MSMDDTPPVKIIETEFARCELYAKYRGIDDFLYERIKAFLEAFCRGSYDPNIFGDNFLKSRIGQRLWQMRQRRGLTQRELSEVSGVPQSEISRYERHLRIPGSQSARRLGVALNCEYWLFL